MLGFALLFSEHVVSLKTKSPVTHLLHESNEFVKKKRVGNP